MPPPSAGSEAFETDSERTHRVPRRRAVDENSAEAPSDQPEAAARVFLVVLQGLIATIAGGSGWYVPVESRVNEFLPVA